ncbi:hypothetical protein LDG_6180 [Legionella drancourtii LLAP12]|uniref:Transposase IS4-like domain-containing protein n=1 Tax=Legionella drancourtii LLAP12 TaxID=658187 RepID=G9ELB8_9GAMM|nr:hypothetical protein LDG_6180 [Legionella drancourtii LLAP12]
MQRKAAWKVHDSKAAPQLIERVDEAEHFIADKGYDSDEIRDKFIEKINSTFDSYLYKMRHLVENLFARLKHFHSIATKYLISSL